VIVLATNVFEDERGFFTESFRADYFAALGLPTEYPQDSHTRSRAGVIRGLHFQHSPAMGKVTRVVNGSAFFVALDIRKESPTFGKWAGVEVSAENKKQMWIPTGFAFGYCVLADGTEVLYKCTSVYDPKAEGIIRYDDPDLGIQWPSGHKWIVSQKDQNAPTLKQWLASPISDTLKYERKSDWQAEPVPEKVS
jgi:dTDP-4-dehydrorhamnose 3,5-epimerase